MDTKSKAKTPSGKEWSSKHDPNALTVPMQPDAEPTKVIAELATSGVVTNATLVQQYSAGTFGSDKVSLDGCVAALKAASAAVHTGDLQEPEAILVAQAAALNVIFCELARRARLNMGEHLHATETYMRLALKAQAQARATIEALATIKSPPVVFARQANINNGGQQQVNNAPAPAAAPLTERLENTPPVQPIASSAKPVPAPAEIPQAEQGELLTRGRRE